MKNLISAMTVGCLVSAAQAATWEVTLELNGAGEVPSNASTATAGSFGSGIRYDDVSNILSLNVAYGLFGFQPLTGTFDKASLGLGAAGNTGFSLIDLASIQFPITTQSGIFSGNIALPQELESALFEGNIYMNINSSAFPGGEIRGQLTVVPEPEVVALAVLGFGGLVLAMRRRLA